MSNELTIDKPEYKVLNKSLMAYRRNKQCSWDIRDNIFETVKAYCIWDAKDSASNYLPRFLPYVDEDVFPDLAAWRGSFTSDNPPEKVSFKGKDKQLAEAIADIDFSKPYDTTKADSIRALFTISGQKKTQVDADLIIQGELGELPEQQSEYRDNDAKP